jgi:DNA-binding CsgD family transcriptional regulator
VLYGREDETKIIARMLEEARAGTSGVLAVVGEPGIGKSALLEYAEGNADGMSVLRARGVQSEATIPFAGLFELLRPALGCLERLPSPQMEALNSALALGPGPEHARFAVGAATLNLLAAYAEDSPVLVVVDDAHWLDGSSADALLFAFRRLVVDPVAVIMSVRHGAPSLLDGSGLATIPLGGLDLQASMKLLSGERAGRLSDHLAERLHRETGGNPLALLELADQVDALDDAPTGAPLPVGASVAAAYLHRYQSLPDHTRDVLLLVAAADRTDLSVLAKAASKLGRDIGDLIPAESAGLIAARTTGVEFSHPLARSAIYGEAQPDQRRQAHRALADSLPDVDVDRRAWHLALAAFGPDESASSALEQAGRRAHHRSAYEVASRAYEMGARLAVDENRQSHLLLAAAEAAWVGGLADRATGLLGDALRRERTTSVSFAAEHLRGHIAIRCGPVAEAQAILLAASEQAASIDPDRAVEMLAETVFASFCAGDATTMIRASDSIAGLVRPDSQARTAFYGLIAQGMAQIFSASGDGGVSQVRQAFEVLDGSAALRDDLGLLAWAAMVAPWLRGALGQELGERALAAARRQSAVGLLPTVLMHVCIAQTATERWAAARAGLHESIALTRGTEQRTCLAWALARVAWLEARQGRTDESRLHANEALELSRERGLGLSEVWAHAALGDLELALDRPELALGHFDRQQAMLDAWGIGDVDLSPGPERVEIYLRLGRVEEAAETARQYDVAAAAKGHPWALARGARCRGLVASDEAIDDCYQAALEQHQDTADIFETGRTLLAYSSQLRRARKRVQAREHLRAAIDIFDDLDADPWSEKARTELAATGETSRRRDPTTLNDLTPQELQIALRLSEGRTTREAATALFLSPKTVEYHLGNIYRKLGIKSRTELVDTMTRHH